MKKRLRGYLILLLVLFTYSACSLLPASSSLEGLWQWETVIEYKNDQEEWRDEYPQIHKDASEWYAFSLFEDGSLKVYNKAIEKRAVKVFLQFEKRFTLIGREIIYEENDLELDIKHGYLVYDDRLILTTIITSTELEYDEEKNEWIEKPVVYKSKLEAKRVPKSTITDWL